MTYITAPREPTEAMIEAGLDVYGLNPDCPDEEVEAIYRAMLAARPPAPDHAELIAAARNVVDQHPLTSAAAIQRLRAAIPPLDSEAG